MFVGYFDEPVAQREHKNPAYDKQLLRSVISQHTRSIHPANFILPCSIQSIAGVIADKACM